MKCANEISEYLQSHTNWGNPVIPSEPGCPGIVFTKSYFIDQAQHWYCDNDIGEHGWSLALYLKFMAYEYWKLISC